MIITFIALLVVAGFSIAMMIMGESKETNGSSLLLVKNIADVVLWAMFAVWFLVLILYKSNTMGHKGLNIVTSLTALVVFVKAILSIAFVLYVNPAAWTMIFSVIELIIWTGLLVCMVRVWFQSGKA